MPLEPLDAVHGIEVHRLDQIEALPGSDHKFPLGQTFAPFFSRFAVGDDSGTQSQRGAMRSVAQVALRRKDERADRDIERRLAIGRDEADRTCLLYTSRCV